MKINFTEKDVLSRGVEEIIEERSLRDRLRSGKKLRIKFGIDPTSSDIHLGHTAPLWKLRQFQELGHVAVLVIGDYTALIGDPSGKDKTRFSLTGKQIKQNYETYEKQILKILKTQNLEIRYQTEWYRKFTLKQVIELESKISVGQLLSHDTFRKRLKEKQQFSAHELLYPFLQGYDSVVVEADVELGAIEQKFNLLMGREIQRAYKQKPQDIVMGPYLLGTRGKEKMSKSLDNYIAIQDKPENMFGKIMSITDDEIVQYFELITPLSFKEVQDLKKEKIVGKRARDLKLDLAELVTSIYWGDKKTIQARIKFQIQFQKQKLPKELPKFTVNKNNTLINLLVEIKFASSKSDARRLIQQGAVYVDGKRITVLSVVPRVSFVLRVGRRKIAKVVLK